MIKILYSQVGITLKMRLVSLLVFANNNHVNNLDKEVKSLVVFKKSLKFKWQIKRISLF